MPIVDTGVFIVPSILANASYVAGPVISMAGFNQVSLQVSALTSLGTVSLRLERSNDQASWELLEILTPTVAVGVNTYSPMNPIADAYVRITFVNTSATAASSAGAVRIVINTSNI